MQDETEGPGPATVCFECGAEIAAGAWRRHVEQQEEEECRRCEWEQLEPGGPPCVEHDYGETFSCDLCEGCHKLLQAIAAAEADAGCPFYARQPLFGDLRETMRYDDGRYRRRALAMFPELTGHPMLEAG